MTANVTALPATPAFEPKQRTITLTNRAPIQIVEAEWPVLSQGTSAWDHPGCNDGWSIDMRVRKGHRGHGYIIHANYKYFVEDDPDACQMVRVGRVLTDYEAAAGLWKHMAEVSEELHARIEKDVMKKYATQAVDQCFANLPAAKY